MLNIEKTVIDIGLESRLPGGITQYVTGCGDQENAREILIR